MKLYEDKVISEIIKHGNNYVTDETKLHCPECNDSIFLTTELDSTYKCNTCGCIFKQIVVKQPTKAYKIIDRIILIFIVLFFWSLVVFAILANVTERTFYALLGVISMILCFIFCCIYSCLDEDI